MESVAVLLDARSAQAGETMAVDGGLPGKEFFDSKRVTLTGFFQAQQATANSRDNLCLPADDPAPRVRRRKIRNRQGLPSGPMTYFTRGRIISVIGLSTQRKTTGATLTCHI